LGEHVDARLRQRSREPSVVGYIDLHGSELRGLFGERADA
jgi:hypothetical protein